MGNRHAWIPKYLRAARWSVVLLSLFACGSVDSQVLISAEPIVSRDVAWLQENNVPGAVTGVSVVKLTYWTPDLNGEPSVATAAFVSPEVDCPTSLVCYLHGTTFLRTDVPSTWEEGTGSVAEGYVFGGQEMACVLPDLLGLGDSPGTHPYLHSASEATATMDAIRAAREYREQLGVPLGPQLFMMGVSAGAHAAFASAQRMQEDHPDEFQVAALAGINGPYSVYETMKVQMAAEEATASIVNLPYVLLTYNNAYGSLFNSTTDFLQPPYNVTVPALFDGTHDFDEILAYMPTLPENLVPMSLRWAVINLPFAPLSLKLKQNNVFNWAPLSPVRMYYCGGDQRVPPVNSTIALEKFQDHGAMDVTAIEASPIANHAQCGALSRPQVEEWFFSLHNDCNGTIGVGELPGPSKGFTISPNPTSSGSVSLDLGEMGFDQDIQVTTISLGGKIMDIQAHVDEQGEVTLPTDQLADGLYIVELRSGDTVVREKLVVL